MTSIRKYFFIGFAVLVISFPLFSMESEDRILIAPILYYNIEGSIEKISDNPNVAIQKFFEKNHLKKGTRVTILSDEDEIISARDAERFCLLKKAGYVVYGFIRNNTEGWNGELRVFKNLERKVSKTVTASGSSYQSLLDSMCYQLMDYFYPEKKSSMNRKSSDYHFRIPAGFCYWMPVEKDWRKTVTGVGGGKLGLDIRPFNLNIFANEDFLYFTARFTASYRFGVEKTVLYERNHHSFGISGMIMLHADFNRRHGFYYGIGPMLERNLMVLNPDHGDSVTSSNNRFLLVQAGGYQFNINDGWMIFFELEYQHYFDKECFDILMPVMGISVGL